MAYPDLFGIDFGDIGNVAAMAPTVDLHKSLLQAFSRRYVYASADSKPPNRELSGFSRTAIWRRCGKAPCWAPTIALSGARLFRASVLKRARRHWLLNHCNKGKNVREKIAAARATAKGARQTAAKLSLRPTDFEVLH
jgi:hypothetical protein